MRSDHENATPYGHIGRLKQWYWNWSESGFHTQISQTHRTACFSVHAQELTAVNVEAHSAEYAIALVL